MSQHHILRFLLPILILLPVLYRRLQRMRKAQPLKWRQLWVRPAIILLLAAIIMGASPPAPKDWPWLGLALALGAFAGWQWGRSMAIQIHPKDGTLIVKGGQAAILIFLVLILFRLGIKSGLQLKAGGLDLSALLISDASILFSAGLLACKGLEMFLRAKRVKQQSP